MLSNAQFAADDLALDEAYAAEEMTRPEYLAAKVALLDEFNIPSTLAAQVADNLEAQRTVTDQIGLLNLNGTVAGVGDLPGGAANGDTYVVENNGHVYIRVTGLWKDLGVYGGRGGSALYAVSGAPSAGLGIAGDMAINLATGDFYGPKTSGGWGSPVLSTGLDAKVTAAAGSATSAAAAAGIAGTIGAFPLIQAGYTAWTGLSRIKKLSLFGATDPTKRYYVRFFYYRDTGTRAAFTVYQTDYDGSNGTNVAAFGVSSGASYTGLTPLLLKEQNNSGITGSVLIDFGDGTTVYPSTTGSLATTEIQPWVLDKTAAGEDDIAAKTAAKHEYGFFEAPPAGSTRANVDILAARIKDLVIFGADKARKPYVKYLYFHDVPAPNDTRFGIEVWGVDADGTSNDAVIAKYTIGSGAAYTGVKLITLSDASANITGYALIDFGDGSTGFTLAPSPASYLTAGIKRDRMQSDDALLAWLSRAQLVSPGSRKPFADTMNTDMLRRFVKKWEIWNGNRSHTYIIARLKKGTNYVRVTVKDLTDDKDFVCNFTLEDFDGTASFSGSVMTVATKTSGSPTKISVGDPVYGAGIAAGVTVLSLGTGTGGVGTYNLSASVGTIATQAITVGPNLTTLPSKFKIFFNNGVSTDPLRTAIYSVFEVDWSQVPITASEFTYTTVAQSGIHPDNVHDPAESGIYMRDDGAEERIYVGTEAYAQFSTLGAALASLYQIGTLASGGFSGPFFKEICNRTTPRHRIEIVLLTSGEASQTIDGVTYKDCFAAAGEFVPEYVQIRGRGKFNTLIYGTDATKATLQPCHSHKVFDLTAYNNQSAANGSGFGQYALHVDPAAYAMDDYPSMIHQMHHKNVELIGGPSQSMRLLGGGFFGGTNMIREGCTAKYLNPNVNTYAVLMHNTAVSKSYRSGTFREIGCSADGPKPPQFNLQSLGALTEQVCVLENCDYSQIQHLTVGDFADLARKRREWALAGRFDGAINMYDAGMLVLATTPGVAPSGDAVALIFGALDELGRGEKCINGTAYTLGVRLGDCSSVNKTLTIGAQTFTFNANYTAQSNSTIIAAINAVLTTNPVSSLNISMEDYPRMGFTRTMLNSSGATIGNPAAAGPARGVFVKRTGVNTIAVANDEDEVFGFVPRPILNGQLGVVVTARRFFCGYIAGSHTMSGANFVPTTGPFGVAAGAYSAAATTKIGTIGEDGGVRLY